MSEHSFGLHERPFPAAPLTSAYFPAGSIEAARRQLYRCIQRAEGAGVLVGGAGMGKSQLLHVLAAEFQGRFHVAHLAGAALCTRRALLQNILFELGLPYRGLQEGELRLSLMDHLQPSRQCPHGMVLLIDEAHTLPLRLLEEVRLLTNLVREGMPRVILVLAGSRSLEERLTHPKLDSFQQRIAVRAYLEPWSTQETVTYIQQEIARCGGSSTLFSDDALRAIHVAAAGVPRLVNQLGYHALTLADSLGLVRIDAAAIHAAWGEIQRLPTPWIESAPVAASASIEFGVLEDAGESAVVGTMPIKDLESIPNEPAVGNSAELFGDGFDSEEIVLDRHVALDVAACGIRRQVVTPLGQAFAAEVAETVSAPVLKLAEVAEEPDARPILTVRTSAPLAVQVALAFSRQAKGGHVELDADDQGFDPVYPETGVPESPTQVQVVAIDAGQGAAPRPHYARSSAGGRFHNLFASLRGKPAQSDPDSH